MSAAWRENSSINRLLSSREVESIRTCKQCHSSIFHPSEQFCFLPTRTSGITAFGPCICFQRTCMQIQKPCAGGKAVHTGKPSSNYILHPRFSILSMWCNQLVWGNSRRLAGTGVPTFTLFYASSLAEVRNHVSDGFLSAAPS
jgi:hypothetical protein